MKKRIIIADDDPMIVSLVSLRLEMADFEVIGAVNGHEALMIIRAAQPALAILDVQMPGKTGLKVLDELKADPATRKLPVMILSGERDGDTVRQAVDTGAADFMVKPFNPDKLLERVSRLTNLAAAPVWEI